MKSKFKVGDIVVYLGDLSDTGSALDVGDRVTIIKIEKRSGTFLYHYYNGEWLAKEFEEDLRALTKLELSMK